MSAPIRIAEEMLDAMRVEGVGRVPVLACTCGSDRYTVVAPSDRHGIPVEQRQCLDCGTVRGAWAPADGWLYRSGWYRRLHTQRGGAEERRAWGRRQWRELCRLARLPDPETAGHHLVELGADQGGLCEAAASDGWDAVPVEVGDPIPSGATVYVALHVLEHLVEPTRWLRAIAARAGRASTIWLAVPHLELVHEGEDAREGGLAEWWTIAHVWHWTESSILHVVAGAGCAVRRTLVAPPGTLATVGSILLEIHPGPTPARVHAYIREHTVC